MDWVATVAAGLSAALVLGLIARRLGLSPIVGYLLAGVAVGPHTPGFVGNTALAGQIADVGVILLMFGVGLGFSLDDLLSVRRVAVPGALIASSCVFGLGTLVGVLAGFEPSAAVVFGLCFTSASTVVIVRGLLELDLLSSAAGRIAVGWSVVEDLIVVLVLVVLPAIAATGEGSGGSLGTALLLSAGKVALLTAITFGLGPRLVPPLLSLVARSQSRELFTLAVLVVALGVAFAAAEVFSVSIALGAFLGGMVVGRSDLGHQAAADALPLRDAFAVLFFVAVGMLFDPRFVLERPGLVAASLLVVIVAKPIVAFAVLLWRGHALRPALAVSAGIAQVSEFAFVLAGNAVALGVLPPVARDAVLSTVLLSITASPLVFRATVPLERWLARRAPVQKLLARAANRTPMLPATGGTWSGHAVLLGHGRVGSVLAALLQKRDVSVVVIEQDRAVVERLRAQGMAVLYGDGGSPVLLDSAGIAAARMLVVTTPDPATVRLAVEHASRVNDRIEVVARVHSQEGRAALQKLPRTQGVHAELELAYAMARSVLQAFGTSAIEAEAAVIDLRRADGAPVGSSTRVVEIRVPAASKVIGKRIVDLGLPPGALVITIGRGSEFVVPNGSSELLAGDALLVLANADAARAIEAIVAG